MGRAYSNDLRERVVKAVIKGGLSRRQAATQFGGGHGMSGGFPFCRCQDISDSEGEFKCRDHASRHEPDLDASNPHIAARDYYCRG
jgi:hypothetical protein